MQPLVNSETLSVAFYYEYEDRTGECFFHDTTIIMVYVLVMAGVQDNWRRLIFRKFRASCNGKNFRECDQIMQILENQYLKIEMQGKLILVKGCFCQCDIHFANF